jgi:Ohr subfamily peroxiredoxin
MSVSFPTRRSLVAGSAAASTLSFVTAAAQPACFEGAIRFAALRRRIKLPADVAIDAEVDLHLDDGEYFLGARLAISISGLERSVAQDLVDAAETICPYSKAISGNVAVSYRVV